MKKTHTKYLSGFTGKCSMNHLTFPLEREYYLHAFLINSCYMLEVYCVIIIILT